MKNVLKNISFKFVSVILLLLMIVNNAFAQFPKPNQDLMVNERKIIESELDIMLFVFIVFLSVFVVFIIHKYQKSRIY